MRYINLAFIIILLVHFMSVQISIAADNTTSTSTTIPPVPVNATESNPTSASTVEVTTSATTAATTRPSSISTSTAKPKPPKLARSPFCFCDQYVNKCEINCCCDLDCTPKEKQIFSTCSDYDLISQLTVSTRAREKACYRQDYIYSNNTPFLIQHRSNSLFCMVSDNFRKEPVYDVPRTQFKSKFARPNFRWTSLASLNVQKLKISTTGYKYGSLILSAQQVKSHNDTEFQVQYFELPSNIHGKSCAGLEALKFLQNTDTVCQHEMSENDLGANCESMSSFNAKTFFNPNATIIGKIDLKSSDDKLVYFNFTSCKDEKLDNCAEIDGNKIPSPKYEARQCKNVLKTAHMTLVHEGTSGIVAIVVQLYFTDISLVTGLKSFPNVNLPRQVTVEQQFKVRYLWKDEFQALLAPTNSTDLELHKRPIPDLPKSGNPGYLIGKPIIVGNLITNADVKSRKSGVAKQIGKSDNETLVKLQDTTLDGKEPFGIALNRDSSYYLNILNAGTCHEKNRRPVLFGMNMKSSCELPMVKYKYCEELKADVGLILLGTNPSNFTKRLVATFGDPFILQSMSDWIPTTILNNPFASTPNSVSLISNGCNNGIITSLHIQIIFAYIGPVVFPQAQLRGIIYEFGEPIGNLRQASNRDRERFLSLSTTVEFHDITSTPTHKMAQWPTISIQLPSDFFYPFSSSKGRPTYSNKAEFVQLVLVILVGLRLYSN